MPKRLFPCLMLYGAVLLLGGCAGTGQVQMDAETNAGGVWYLEQFGEPTQLQGPLEGTEVRIEMDLPGGSLSGTAGCNQFNATVKEEGAGLRIGPLAMTKKMCVEPAGVMAQENAVANALGAVSGYRIEGGKLILSCGDGRQLIFGRDGAPGSTSAAGLSSLRSFGGQYPRDINLFANPALAGRLQALLGEFHGVFVRNMKVQGPLQAFGDDLLYVTGNRAHEGGAEMAALVISPAKDQLQVWLATGGKGLTFTEKEPPLPDPDDVRAVKSNFDTSP